MQARIHNDIDEMHPLTSMKHRPDIDLTSIDIDATSPDIDATSPDIDQTSPDIDQTSIVIDATSPKHPKSPISIDGSSPDIDPTSIDIDKTSMCVDMRYCEVRGRRETIGVPEMQKPAAWSSGFCLGDGVQPA